MAELCPECGGRVDWPGLYGCEEECHPVPTVAQEIAAAIEHDIRDRRGIGDKFDGIDSEIQYQIRGKWAKIIGKILESGPLRSIVGEPERPAARDDPGRPSACCYDCLRPYGGEHGFPDLVISDAAWRAISPAGDQYGLLCPSCICKRLHEAGIETVGAFTGGPVRLVGADEMTALLKAERLAADPGRLSDESDEFDRLLTDPAAIARRLGITPEAYAELAGRVSGLGNAILAAYARHGLGSMDSIVVVVRDPHKHDFVHTMSCVEENDFGRATLEAALRRVRLDDSPAELPAADEPPPSLKRSVDKWEDEGGAAAPET
jgi:hypothetical protein